MKKMFFAAALAITSFAFANTSDVKNVKLEESKTTTSSTKEESKTNFAKFLADTWSVTFTNSCGGTTSATFTSEYADGSAGFIKDLAHVVNTADAWCDGNGFN
jgi:hypothetical protein